MKRRRKPGPLAITTRRQLLGGGLSGASLMLFGVGACSDESSSETGSSSSGGSGSGSGGGGGGGGGSGVPMRSNIANLGPLDAPDANGVRLPQGFTSRIVARSGQMVENSDYLWHGAPDGGATFPTEDGGWIYVSNAELNGVAGGVGAIRFGADGNIVGAYSILGGTARNCAGGLTPWGSWLSCEEVSNGEVYECDPFGSAAAIRRSALGVFNHEAVAVDPATQQLYLTEDEPDGRLYRFTPAQLTAEGYADLNAGTLEVAQVAGNPEGMVSWLVVPDPAATTTATRQQVAGSTAFDGGEGIWFHQGVVYFTTKGDNRVWAFDTLTSMLTLIYDRSTSPTPILSGVDNVTVSPDGDVLVAEDGGDLEIVAIAPTGVPTSLIQLVGHDASEITGPAFDPSLTRLYFSSQRGTLGSSSNGMTFEISGPFFVPA
jgi:secreted PhoX family phosphatase